jgi:hypothetical protein
LQRALQNQPSLELRRRAEDLLEKLAGAVPAPEELRVLRALQVLEQIDTPEARQVIQTLAEETPVSWLRQDARECLERLSKRRNRP